jgi:hypothetical protein
MRLQTGRAQAIDQNLNDHTSLGRAHQRLRDLSTSAMKVEDVGLQLNAVTSGVQGLDQGREKRLSTL